MRLLIDTHALLWWFADDPALGPRSRAAIADPRNETFVSALTLAEIPIKQGMTGLALTPRHGRKLAELPPITATRSTACSSHRRSRRGSPS